MLGNQKYPADIDRKDPVPVFDVNLLELPRETSRRGSCVVAEHIQSAKFSSTAPVIFSTSASSATSAWIKRIGAGIMAGRSRLFRLACAARIVDRNFVAGFCERNRLFAPDPRRGACDQRHPFVR